MIRSTTLSSGLRVVTEAVPHVRSVTIGVWCDVGSAAEPRNRRGISHLLEHMVFKGTEKRTARRIAEEVDAVGGELNAATDRESTVFYATVVDRHVPLAVDVLGDLLLGARLDAGDLAREKDVVLEEIRMYEDNPDDVVADAFTRALWRDTNLGDPIIGTRESVTAIDRETLVAWRAARYGANTMLVTAAGNLDHDAVVALVERAFGAVSRRAEPMVPETPPFTPAIDVTVDETEQAYVMLGMPGLSLTDERRYALSVLDTLLGGGMSSRLFQTIREEQGLAYEIHTFQQSYRAAGLLGISMGTAPEKVQRCADLVGQELDRLLEDGAREDEVARAREHLKGNLTLALESTSSRMSRLARGELIHGRQIPIDEVEARFDAVTVADVDALARELCVPALRGWCLLGPLDASRLRLRAA